MKSVLAACAFSTLALFLSAQEPPLTDPSPGRPPLLQSQVKGLLVITLPDGSNAGAATQMNATALKREGRTGFTLRFNQQVGPLMKGATAEVEKFMKVRHAGSLPKGYDVEFGFANKHSLKDGPSAAVACALMTDAIITGKPLDPKFAATGDMTATGEVRPIGGVAAKIRGASRKNCTVFSVPQANATAIDDMYITEGLAAVAEIQIIAVQSFDEALAIATLKKSPEITRALADFEMVQKAVLRSEKNAGHSKVQAKLRSILKAIPGHRSARLVALHGQGRGPEKLSLVGSLNAIEQKAGKLAGILNSGNLGSPKGFDDPLLDTVFELDRIRPSLDPRTTGLLDRYAKIGSFFKKHRESKHFNTGEQAELRTLLTKLAAEQKKISNNREIREELMTE